MCFHLIIHESQILATRVHVVFVESLNTVRIQLRYQIGCFPAYGTRHPQSWVLQFETISPTTTQDLVSQDLAFHVDVLPRHGLPRLIG